MMYAGVDFASGSDATAICIARQCEDGLLRIEAMAQSFQAVTLELVSRVIEKITRDMARPKGYSQSHWRKIYRQSPLMRPIQIIYDRAPSTVSERT